MKLSQLRSFCILKLQSAWVSVKRSDSVCLSEHSWYFCFPVLFSCDSHCCFPITSFLSPVCCHTNQKSHCCCLPGLHVTFTWGCWESVPHWPGKNVLQVYTAFCYKYILFSIDYLVCRDCFFFSWLFFWVHNGRITQKPSEVFPFFLICVSFQ